MHFLCYKFNFELKKQKSRKNNPNLNSLPVYVNVVLPQNDKFVFQDLLKSKYKYEVIGGQHITQADHEIVIANYTTATLKNAPNSLVYKQVQIFVNLSKEEKALVVTVDNQRIQRPESNVDKVI